MFEHLAQEWSFWNWMKVARGSVWIVSHMWLWIASTVLLRYLFKNAYYLFILIFKTTEHAKNPRKFKRKSKTRQWSPTSILSDIEALKNSITSEQIHDSYSNKTGNIRGKNSHRRTKRFLSYPRYVEVMVVADTRMVAYHGSNLQHYILTLMSIVSM